MPPAKMPEYVAEFIAPSRRLPNVPPVRRHYLRHYLIITSSRILNAFRNCIPDLGFTELSRLAPGTGVPLRQHFVPHARI